MEDFLGWLALIAFGVFCIRMSVIGAGGRAMSHANYSPGMTPIGYERWCAGQLEATGWQVILTPPSGDQGADIIGEMPGIRVVFQCKLYSKPVGNKAVQEIVSARAFYGAHYAAVVTNARYTQAAIELSRSNAVMLMHHNELRALARKITQP
ncbi:MAG: restriction endonuclease [Bradyrhizobium sp.]|nr:restriction endonuclease [Bradyrhizobium sp.]